MSFKYLPEHAHAALLALDLARKEAEHLLYSQCQMFFAVIESAEAEIDRLGVRK